MIDWHIAWIEIFCSLAIIVAIGGTVIHRIITKKGIGVRAIQFIAVTTLIPVVLILALEKIFDGSAVAGIIGALAGYLFSHISEFDKKRGTENKDE